MNKTNWPQYLVDQFWSNINYPGNDQDCWEWVSPQKHKDGYGRFKNVGAHRLAWEFYNGPIPQGQQVLHKCDNPPCCNPEHLFLGTTQDNRQDCVNKNRQAKGSKNAGSVLTEEIVFEILEKVNNGEITNLTVLSNTYNISESALSHIFDGTKWKHITINYKTPMSQLKLKIISPKWKLTETDVHQIKIDISNNVSLTTIAKQYGVKRNTILDIKLGKNWKWVV